MILQAWLVGGIISVSAGVVVGAISRDEQSKRGARVALLMILAVPIWPSIPFVLLYFHCKRLAELADIKLPRLLRSGQIDHRTAGNLSEPREEG